MKLKFLLLGAIFALFSDYSQAQSKKNQLLILGSYHMSNPGQDVANLEADNVLSEKRQREILEVVELLKKYKPTHIAVESRYRTKYDTAIQQRYQQYLDGKFELRDREDEQIGFRIGKEMNHKQIFAVDAQGRFDFNAVVEYAMSHGQKDIFLQSQNWLTEFIKEEQEYLLKHSIKEILLRMNEPKRLMEGHGQYVKMLDIGGDLDYPAGQLLTDWYERNIKIFSNLIRISEGPTEETRVLLIIGAGHAPILRNMAIYHPYWEIVEVSEYLD